MTPISVRLALSALVVLASGSTGFSTLAGAEKPNVILVITDDQGYGDLAAHGNTMIQTPHMDQLRLESVRLTNFHVDPTCAPTRSALMTGRYSTRTGVWHTIMGRSLMNTGEVTLAEMFKSGGYRTGMFGKWHLGDNYPLRPQDQGFDEAFYHGGGGVGQTPDHFGNDYFDDTYFRNGKLEKVEGYCTDVWFQNAMEFMKKSPGQPFLAYISTNAPHGPYLVAESYKKPYLDRGVPTSMASFYGMITNIDENLGKLRAMLKRDGLEENTILIFMTDNGTAAGFRSGRQSGRKKRPSPTASPTGWTGFNAGMRGTKGSEYEGGHRVPLFIRWPGGGITGGRDVGQLSAHVDVLPTLASLCGLKKPAGVALDGSDLSPLLRGKGEGDWPDRTLFVHSQRLEFVERGRKNSVMTQRYRLVNNKELYDIQADPGQTRNIAEEKPKVLKKLLGSYDRWWESLSPIFDTYVRIVIGSDMENPSRLTCHDWHTGDGPVPWNHGQIRNGAMVNGFWAVDVARDGEYQFTLCRWPEHLKKGMEASHAKLKIGGVEVEKDLPSGSHRAVFNVKLKKGPTRLETVLTNDEGKSRGAYYVYVKRL